MLKRCWRYIEPFCAVVRTIGVSLQLNVSSIPSCRSVEVRITNGIVSVP